MATSARKAALDPKKLTRKQRFWREVRGYAEAIVIAFLVVTFLFTTVGVVGSSMRPTLHGGSGRLPESLITGDRVFIPKYDTWLRRAGILGPFERGEIVVVREPANAPSAQFRAHRPFFIKRLIGIPGDRIKIVEGQVYVNGHPVDQSFITESGEIIPDPVNFPVITVQNGEVVGFLGLSPNTWRLTATGRQPAPVTHPNVQLFYGGTIAALAPIPADAPEGVPFVHELIVPEDHYFILGDNRQAARGGSEDSRYFGPIRAITVAGRANAVIWPPMRDGEWNWRRLGPPEAFAAIPDPR
jgi:signal peptidase I